MTKKIKILYTIPNFDTAGSGKVVYDLVKGLDAERFEAHICCTHSHGAFFKQVEALGVPIHIFPFYTTYRPYYNLPLRVYKIARFFKQHRFDLIHSWHWSSDITEPLAAKLARIPFVYTKKAMSWGNKAWRWRSRLSSHIIAINTDMMGLFFEGMTHKTSYIPLGVDTAYFKPLEKTYTSPEGLQFSASDVVIVSVANLVPVKGIELLLEAVKQCNDPNIKVLIVGDDQSAYGQELQERYADSSISFVGKQLDVRPYLALADVFVIPTKDEGRKEGLPIAPLEAMACGRIVIGSHISGVKDVLSSFHFCLFKPNDVGDLVKKINQIKTLSFEKRIELGLEMNNFVKREFSLSKVIINHEQLYLSIKQYI
ncbi:glycosyltransferase involved in cell wall biosynthesis [Flavobacteriaceae bacterium MAR_2010_105]|nr:glycosyltransferase involved in cell wall biosynthesis [Flavobacteriaceae bacterium MAR_2010_105]